jgi:uncharacterized membrane protein
MFCQYCGAQIEPHSQFCQKCGRAQSVGGAGSTPPPGMPPGYQPPLQSPPPFVPPPGVHAQTGRWIGAGWHLVKEELGMFMLLSLLFVLLNAFVPILLQGPLIAGFCIVCTKKLLYGRFELGDFFKGFNFFVAALVASLIITVFTFIGTIFCIIPGLVIAAMYQFTYLFIIDKKLDFWPAMQASHALVKNDYFGFTLFFVAAILLNIIGFLCCVVGILATMPILYAAVTVAYKEMVGFEPSTNF